MSLPLAQRFDGCGVDDFQASVISPLHYEATSQRRLNHNMLILLNNFRIGRSGRTPIISGGKSGGHVTIPFAISV